MRVVAIRPEVTQDISNAHFNIILPNPTQLPTSSAPHVKLQ
jgi:hypothetical protein